MKTNTQIEFNLTIKDISSIYSKNFNEMILRQVKELYEGKCIDSQYILSIDYLVKRSLPNLIKRDLDAKVRIFVIVSATVIRYDKYDTINKMVINKIIPKGKIGPFDLLECSNDHCKALIKLDERLPEFKIGDVIPIKVGTIMFKINNNQVLVNAYPFVPHKMEPIAYAIQSLSSYEKEIIANQLIPLLQSQIARQKEVDVDRAKYFEKLLYPFKVDESKKIIGSAVDLITFLENIDKYVGKHVMIDQKINMSNLKVSIITNTEEVAIVNDRSQLSKIVFSFFKHLELISELSEIYKDGSFFEKHQYIWNLYEQNKF